MQHIDDLLVLEQTEGMAFVSDNLWGTPVTPSAFGGQLVALSLAAAFKTVPENYLARKGMPDVALPGSTSDCPFVLDPQGYPKAFPAMIWVTELDRDHATPAPPRQQMWLECPDKQQRSEQAKQCIVAMYSDVHFTRVIVRPYGIRIAPPPRHLRKIVSIDHHMWFHQEADPNNPILVDTWCSQLSSGRGVVQSEMFAHDRRLVATIMQEGRVEIDPSAQLPSPKL
ncbi:hypothetical protein LPJ78_000918 [Coemansia sp. RSA 989]|nr:hypothetical protein LPJ68_000741 [Coemansia sp. RSA 1086]KAJ1752887.1 hypothetical protein LPJ79_000874 [Coemansia sp. RSA 1821]KAJ1867508.1 hypothetical protein LPJ78_000918 [Coemansia sp. RSA 989]KAJ1875768.1 hypothetical protein LPJ55_000394 [Coemansia sp. RSA 990]